MTFVLLKNGTPAARLVPELIPEKEKIYLGRDLARVLHEVELPTDEAVTWKRDLKNGRKSLKPQPDKWRPCSMSTSLSAARKEPSISPGG